MQEKHVLDPVIDPIVKAILRDENLWGLVETGIRPIVRQVIIPRRSEMAQQEEVSDDIHRLLAEKGIYSVSIPEEYGGMGLGERGDTLSIFEIGYGCVSTSLLPLVNNSLFARALQVGGTEEQKKRFLPQVARGELFGCYALTESEGSSFPGSILANARRKGDHYVLRGEKIFITEAQRANIAVVFARIDGERDRVAGFLVPHTDKPPEGYAPGNGYKVTRKERGKPGIWASATCAIQLDDVVVPQEDVLGADFEGERGRAYANKTLGWSRPNIAAQALGAAKRNLAYVWQYALETPRGGGEVHLLEDLEYYRTHLTEMTGELIRDVSLLFATTAAMDLVDIEKDPPLQVYSSMTKVLGTETAEKVGQGAMRKLGGAGYTGEHPVGSIWTDLGVPPIYEGSNDLLRVKAGMTLAKHLKEKFRGSR